MTQLKATSPIALCLSAFAACVSPPAIAAPLIAMDAASFSHVYDGDDIYNGTGYINAWSASTLTNAVTPSLSGSDLTINTPGPNGWIQQTTGSPWTTIGGGSWTFEAQVTLDAASSIGFWLDTAGGAFTGGTVLYAGPSGLGSSANGSQYSALSSEGTHTYRVAYDAPANAIAIYRDGELLTDTVLQSNPPGAGPRLLVGDFANEFTASGFEVGHIAYDTSHAYAPIVPTPTAVLGTGAMLGLMCFGKTRRHNRTTR